MYNTTTESDEKLQKLLAFAQKLMKSPFIMVAFMARAVYAHLECCLQVSRSITTDAMDKEIDHLVATIDHLSRDRLGRRYYLKIIIESLTLLCSNEKCTFYLANHKVMNELQRLMENAKEVEDVIASLIYKIVTGGGEIGRIKVHTELSYLPGIYVLYLTYPFMKRPLYHCMLIAPHFVLIVNVMLCKH